MPRNFPRWAQRTPPPPNRRNPLPDTTPRNFPRRAQRTPPPPNRNPLPETNSRNGTGWAPRTPPTPNRNPLPETTPRNLPRWAQRTHPPPNRNPLPVTTPRNLTRRARHKRRHGVFVCPGNHTGSSPRSKPPAKRKPRQLRKCQNSFSQAGIRTGRAGYFPPD